MPCSIKWGCCALVTVLLTGPLALGQAVKPDAQRFIAVQPEELVSGDA